MSEKLGVFICKCGENIAANTDTAALAKEFEADDRVFMAREHALLCSEDGKKDLEREIRDNGLTRMVVAACSPRQHEHTFRGVCRAAGMNPFLMTMANIREMCAWVADAPAGATGKARAMIRGAVERVLRQEAIEQPTMDVNADALVVGAGVAGLSAALLLAQKGRQVTLVEKSPCVGGMTVRYEDVFPNMDCAPCMLEPIMDDVLHHERIKVLTCAEVADVKGFLGNFIVTVNARARRIEPDLCFGCAECYAPCPVSVPNEFNQCMDQRKAVYQPFPGSLPNVPLIDTEACVRFTENKDCTACRDACAFGAVNYDQEDRIIECKAGAVVLAAGMTVGDQDKLADLGLGKIDGVYSSLELERLISSTGPTEGDIKLRNGKAPQSVAFIHCAGSRIKQGLNYCSGVCCMEALKLDHLLAHKLGKIQSTHYYRDLNLSGKKAQEFCDEIVESGAALVRVADPNALRVSADGDAVAVTRTDAHGKDITEKFDMVVLAAGVAPGPDTSDLSRLFQVDCDAKGFLREAHNRIDPVATNYEGVYIAGCASGPMDIQGAVAAGKAAAGEILSSILPGEKMELEAAAAVIDEDLCTGCLICNTLCPYKAILFDAEAGVSRVNQALCRGCGTCVAACPAGAIDNKNFSKDQILAEIAGVMS